MPRTRKLSKVSDLSNLANKTNNQLAAAGFITVNENGKPLPSKTRESFLFAINNSSSALAAAAFLGIHYTTFKKYAKLMASPDPKFPNLLEWAKDLLEEKRQLVGEYDNTPNWLFNPLIPLDQKIQNILGLGLTIKEDFFIKWLSAHGIVTPSCKLCGLGDLRSTDHSFPFMVVPLDSNLCNISETNLEIVCYNCHFYYYGNIPDIVPRNLKFLPKNKKK